MAEMRGQKVEVNGINIHYEKIGNGSHVVLLLPGALGTSRTDFNEILEGGLDPKKFTLIAWDPPGYGFSRPPVRNYNTNVYRTDAELAANLMKTLGYTLYSVLGWSDGGKTAIFLASNYPAVVDKLVVWGVVSFGLPHTNRAFEATRNMSYWDPAIKKRFADVYGDELEPMWNKLVQDCFTHAIGAGVIIESSVVEKIQCPAYVFHGDKDPMVAVEHAQYLTKHLSDTRLKRYPQASHNLHQTCADDFHKIVTNFLLYE